jgi:hypothetical protein
VTCSALRTCKLGNGAANAPCRDQVHAEGLCWVHFQAAQRVIYPPNVAGEEPWTERDRGELARQYHRLKRTNNWIAMRAEAIALGCRAACGSVSVASPAFSQQAPVPVR